MQEFWSFAPDRALAFHWMEPLATKKGFARILKPGGHIVLAWNLRMKHTQFLKAYEDLQMRFAIDYSASKLVNEKTIKNFYDFGNMHVRTFPNVHKLNFESLKGQLLSCSHISLPGHPMYDDMIDALAQIFVKYNETGLVNMEFQTKIYWNE